MKLELHGDGEVCTVRIDGKTVSGIGSLDLSVTADIPQVPQVTMVVSTHAGCDAIFEIAEQNPLKIVLAEPLCPDCKSEIKKLAGDAWHCDCY